MIAGLVLMAYLPRAASGQSGGIRKLYWTEYGTGKIRRANLDGTGVEDVLSGRDRPYALAVDPLASKIYWVDGLRSIWRANFDGTQAQEVLTGPQGMRSGLAIDPYGGKMYWTWGPGDISELGIRRANLDGSDLEAILTGEGTEGLAVDPFEGKVYWMVNYKVKRSDLDGTDKSVLFSGVQISSPMAIDLDLDNGMAYWTAGSFNTGSGWEGGVVRGKLDGTMSESLYTFSKSRYDIEVDPTGGKLYWSSSSDRIMQSDLDGNNIRIFLDDVPAYGIEVITVPEPVTLGMLALGGLALIRRRLVGS